MSELSWKNYREKSEEEINKSRDSIEKAINCYLKHRFQEITFYYISSSAKYDNIHSYKVPNFIIQAACKGYFGMIINITTKKHLLTDTEKAKINKDKLENYYSITTCNFVEARQAIDRYLGTVERSVIF